MSDGEIAGYHYSTREPLQLRWRAGVLTGVDAPAAPPPVGRWLAPALFDLQVNGYGGVDFQQDGLSSGDLLRAVDCLHRDGCSSILLTLITDRWDALMQRLRRLRELRAQTPELLRAIAGWHVEGPFLSAEPGYCGAHDPGLMLDPTSQHIHELRDAAGTDPLLLTLAPERPGAIEAIARAVSCGMKVSLGHTNAPQAALAAAVQAGATGFTHLGNGCAKEQDRHDNIFWRVFETPGLVVGLIPDRIHVSPAFLRISHRQLGAENVYYTTDAASPAGAPPGRYRLGRLEVEVAADQIVRQPGRTNFAGSALRPLEGVFRAAEMLGCPWQQAWERFSARPRALLGLPAPLAPGQAASFCVVEDVPGRGNTVTVYSHGARRSELPARARLHGAGMKERGKA